MYSLNDYIDSLISLLSEEKNRKRQKEIIQSWIKLLKKHHRIIEIRKIIKLLDDRIFEKKNAEVTVASPEEAKLLTEFFHKNGIKADCQINPEILGGARIIWDNLLIDNSIKGQLINLKKKLTR